MQKLKHREKVTIIAGLVGLLVLLLAWEIYFRENSRWKQYQAARNRSRSREELLEEMVRFERSYVRVQSEVELIRSSLLIREEGVAIQGVLERTAAENIPAAQLVRMGVRTSNIEDLYRETLVIMELQGVSLPELVDFIHSVETGGLNLRVRGLKVDLNRQNPDLLDVEFTVSAVSDLS